ncbi:hypothetical protein LINPERPRIM_LOCUS39428 [Linum perenne]
MPCYAGLPKYVVLKSKRYGKYMHYLWNEEEFAEHYKQMGCKRDLDITNPFVKLEVVPSTSKPSSFVHLRCSYNNKFLKLVSYDGRLWVSATADSPDEEQIYDTSTLFQPVFGFDEPKTVALKHVQSLQYVGVESLGVANMYSESYLATKDICCRFEFSYWESYEEKMNAKDEEMAAKDGEICKLKKEVDAKDDEIQCRGKQIEKLEDQMTAKNKEILMFKGVTIFLLLACSLLGKHII